MEKMLEEIKMNLIYNEKSEITDDGKNEFKKLGNI
jgi:hypothetical protein